MGPEQLIGDLTCSQTYAKVVQIYVELMFALCRARASEHYG